MQYKELTEQQKAVVDDIEKLYINHHSLNEKDFITALAFTLNKYQKKRKV